jgi:MoaA/NifB/PqqE/SkfB family radical SAM enzyme
MILTKFSRVNEMSTLKRLFNFISAYRKLGNSPVMMNYEITRDCNLNCPHCYFHKTLVGDSELSDADWKKTFVAHKEKGAIFAFLSGGEPALRIPVIRAAKAIFGSISVVTNGLIKIPEDINCRLFVSVDGPEDVHDSLRGKGVFAKIAANYQDDRRVILTPTLSTANWEAADQMPQVVRDLGVRGVTYSTYTAHGTESDPLLLEESQMGILRSTLKRVWRENKDVVFLTPKIIDLLASGRIAGLCFLASNTVVTYAPDLSIKRPCVMGAGVNCATCGCIIPHVARAVRELDWRSWLLLNKFFPGIDFK